MTIKMTVYIITDNRNGEIDIACVNLLSHLRLRNDKMNIVVQKNDYLSEGIIPRGCENLLWEATVGDYDLGCKVGHGTTAREAINDLLDQIGEE